VMIDSTRLIDTSRIAASKNTPQNKTKKKKYPLIPDASKHSTCHIHFHAQGPL